MGYRSNVAYQIAFKDKKILNEYIAKVMMLGGDVCNALKECEVVVQEPNEGHSQECYVNFYAEDVKWYPDYKDVIGHTRLYELAVEWYPDDSGFSFIRIGESSDDAEEISDGELADATYDLRIVRSIELPFAHSYVPIGDNLRIFDHSIKG